MGYILNRFDRLMELRNNQAINEQFKLTAIIVHDPKDHKLIDYIKSHFFYFSRATGENFLLITFIEPSIEIADALKRGKYKYAQLLVNDSPQEEGAGTTINPLIRDYYSLPADGSYMVIANKLFDNTAYRVSITKQSLPNQLMYLTEYCDCPTYFDELIRQLEGESINIKEMLGDSLLKIVSLISPSSPYEEDEGYSRPQREMAKQTINEEKQKLLRALRQSSDNEDLTEYVLKIYKIIEYAYRNVFIQGRNNSRRVSEDYCNNYGLLDGKSQTFWKTFSRLDYFIHHDGSQPDELDYSAFILYLAKIVENELNLSICQMLRQSMGIAMPRYYNKYCRETDQAWIPTEKKDVPLNRYINLPSGTRKVLEGVALGDLLHAYMTAIGEEPSHNRHWHVPYPMNLIKIPFEFLSLWEDFKNVRNDAAHSRSVDRDMFDQTKYDFEEFLQSFILILYRIKNNLRRGNIYIIPPNPYDLG